MYEQELLVKLVHNDDPTDEILEYLVAQLEEYIDLDEITSSYETVEQELLDFEYWLHRIWGKSFYETLVGSPEDLAIPKAFRIATEHDANLLFCDGLSIRELLAFKKRLSGRLSFTCGRAPTPTTTESAAKKVLKTNTLSDAFRGKRLFEGSEWTGHIIEKISNPPRIGKKRGSMFLTYYPDAPLHNAEKYQLVQIQDVSKVIHQLTELVHQLSKNTPLVVTGDHGYIFLGNNPGLHLWRWNKHISRHGGDYGENGLNIDGETVALGRFHAPNVRLSGAFITHGGVSLTESLVPIVTIESGA